MVKGGLTLASKIVIEREKMPEYIKYRAPELLKACMAVIAQSAVGCETETRTQLKMAGVIEALMSVIEDYFKGMLPVQSAEYSLLTLINLCEQSHEIQEELSTNDKLHKVIIFTIMSEHSDCFELVSLVISLLRKLMARSKAERDRIAEMYLLTFAAIVEAHTHKVEQIKSEKIIPPNFDPVKAFLLKETIATMGELAAEPEHREALISGADVVFDVLQAAR